MNVTNDDVSFGNYQPHTPLQPNISLQSSLDWDMNCAPFSHPRGLVVEGMSILELIAMLKLMATWTKDTFQGSPLITVW